MKADLQTKPCSADIETGAGGPGVSCQWRDLDPGAEWAEQRRHRLVSHSTHRSLGAVLSVPAHPQWRIDFPSREYSGIIQKIPGTLFLVMDVLFPDHIHRAWETIWVCLRMIGPRVISPTQDTCHQSPVTMGHQGLMTQSRALSPRLMSSSHNLRSPFLYQIVRTTSATSIHYAYTHRKLNTS